MSAATPGHHRPVTWTTDSYTAAPAPTTAPGAPPEPSQQEFAHAVLAALRPFPDAFRALLTVVETFWPATPWPAPSLT